MQSPGPLERLDRRAVRDILILLRNNQVGDLICSQPLYTALKRGFPGAALTVLAAPTNYPIPYRVINPLIDHVEHYDRSLLRSILVMPGLRRKHRWQIGIVPSNVKMSFSLHLLNWLAGPGIRVGVSAIDGRPNPGRFLLNVKAGFPWDSARVHQRERNRDIARLLGCDIDDSELFRNMLSPDPHDEDAADARLEAAGISPGETLIGIHPGAGEAHRMWPVERFAALCSRLQSRIPARFLMIPGPVESTLVREVERAFAALAVRVAILDTVEIGELCAHIRRMRLFVTNDTGPLHVAAAIGCECVYMILPRHVEIWGPRLPHAHAVVAPEDDISTITVDSVLSACLSALPIRDRNRPDE